MMHQPLRIATPILILVIAGVLAWTSSRATSAIDERVHDEVVRMVPRCCLDPQAAEEFILDPVLTGPVMSSFRVLCDRWSGDMDDIAVIVRVGDHAGFGDGSATHVATISLAGDPVAGLRVICTREAGPVRIVGVWSP